MHVKISRYGSTLNQGLHRFYDYLTTLIISITILRRRLHSPMSEKENSYGLSSPANSKESTNVVSLSSRRHRRTKNIQDRTLGGKKVLVVGADNTTYRIIEEFARQEKALAYPATTSDDALDQLESIDYNVVIMVNHPPKVDALNAIKLFKFINTRSQCKFLILHDDPDWGMMVRVHDVDVDAHLPTPFNPVDLKKLINSLLA